MTLLGVVCSALLGRAVWQSAMPASRAVLSAPSPSRCIGSLVTSVCRGQQQRETATVVSRRLLQSQTATPFISGERLGVQTALGGARFPSTPLFNNARRWFSQGRRTTPSGSGSNTDTAIYFTAVVVAVLGVSYAAVPLYRAFCQATGYGGTTSKHDGDFEKVENMVPVEEREITVRFNANTSATMEWGFKPQQRSVTVVPGETSLAFFTATNPTDHAITGISTYNVVPFEAGQYFNKIQCFCFEEQRLNPGEEVDMPVFFYIDPEFAEDPNMMRVNDLTLSYTFFKSSNSDGVDAVAAQPS